MIRKCAVFIMVMLMILSMACPVWAEKVRIDRDLLEKILHRQDALEKEVELLKERLEKERREKTPPTATPSAEDTEYMKADVEEMSERLDTVETQSILDKIQIGGEFRTRLDFYNYHDMAGDDGQKKDGRTDELWSGRLRFNIRSDISDNIIFHGRLSYFKLWGDTNYDLEPADDTHSSTPDSEGNLHVERAYIDYFVPTLPFSVTFGRLPSGDGPPYEFKNNTSRKATWPSLFVNGEYDGILTNLSLDEWTGLRNSMFRLGYIKVTQNYQKYSGLKIDDLRVGVVAFETEIPGVRDSLFWISGERMWDIAPFGFTGVFPEDYGYIDFYNLHIQFDNIKKSGLSWFASFAYNHIAPRSEGAVLGPGYEVGLYCDTAHDNMGESRDGYALYTGLKYRLPISGLKYPSIGFEYNHGSKHWLPAPLSGNGELVNKLAVNGDAYELYYIQPLHEKHMFFRIGAIHMDYDYYNPMFMFGTQRESDLSILNTYFLVDVRF